MAISLQPSETTAALMDEVLQWSEDLARKYARQADTEEGFPFIQEVVDGCPLDVAPTGFSLLRDDEFIDRAHTLSAADVKNTDVEFGPNVMSVFMCDPLSQGDSWAWQLLYGGEPAVGFVKFIGTPEQVKRWCGDDRVLSAIAMTEDQSGTDLAGIQCTAVRDGDDWILNGTKVFISNALEADWLVLVATIDPDAGSKGVRAFVIDRADMQKVEITVPKEDKIGFRHLRNASFAMHDLRIPYDRCIGGEDVRGLAGAMQLFSKNRATCSVWGPSIAKGCVKFTRSWLDGHKDEITTQRWERIHADFDEMIERLDDSIRLSLRAAWLNDKGESNTEAVSHAKAVGPKFAESVVLRCLQVMGHEGASRRHLMEKWVRDVKMTDAVLGPSQVQRRTAANLLLRRHQH
jgi:alkylation response protein AidB-like acyl-CoA dehydrogenase